ncbi:MAG: hypothetical protein ABSF56_03700 [Minisyncoccia bacterium]|jgi:hypothetical protein
MKPNKRNRGLGASIAVIVMAAGVLAMSLAALGSSVFYADAVFRREMRIQAALNEKACLDSAALLKAKDAFAAGIADFPEFGCTIPLSI